ncbi:MAG TPA: glycosyltransferase [Candidatus Acidoferrales bacterium]|nr:glycosyltransferase [Candidatus Acidoferrales bacterium]
MSRCAASRRVFYVEEPIWGGEQAFLSISKHENGPYIVVPHVPDENRGDHSEILRELLDGMIADQKLAAYCLWYYTPMAIQWTRHLRANALSVIYDCMDELSAFRGAAPELQRHESELLSAANLVFTGGFSLYESKRHLHRNVYPFPSSVDVSHFSKARISSTDPDDQAVIPKPRIGFCGVIDERMDLDLVRSVAQSRSNWHFIVIGPVVKISESDLPRSSNIHYLGMKKYEELPAYMAGWDAAILPFAKNEATRFISPTKTPEYLAAGKPVVSTSIADVIRPYGTMGLVHIADDAEQFVASLEKAMAEDSVRRQNEVDNFLARECWSRTWGRMSELIEDSMLTVFGARQVPKTAEKPAARAAAVGRSA